LFVGHHIKEKLEVKFIIRGRFDSYKLESFFVIIKMITNYIRG